MFQDIVKKNWIHVIAIIIFLSSTVMVFYPSYQGKKLQQGDITHWRGMAQESKAFKEETGKTTLWTNSMFSGMPTYYIKFDQVKDPVDYLKSILSFGLNNEAGKFLVGLFLFYILLLFLGVESWLAIFGALAFAYTTNNLVLLNAGHNTKVMTIMTSPMVILGVIYAYRKNMFLGSLLFALGMSLNLKASHPQMTYYLGIVMFIYTLFVCAESIKKGQLSKFLKTSGLLVLGLVIGVGSTANRTIPIYEYSKDTMRGAPILKNHKSNDSSSKVEGLAWEYAMSWSNGSEDLLASFIPLANGGSSTENVDPSSNFGKELRKRGASLRSVKAPLYWGSLPFTSGPIYFGAIIFFLFFLSFFNLKGHMKWWGIIAVLLTFLLSMGKNFEFLSMMFFEIIPYYNKFRTPNSILSITAVIIPLLAMLSLSSILKHETLSKQKVLLPGLGFIVFTILIGLLGPSIFDLSSSSDNMLAQAGLDPKIIMEDRANVLRSSAMKAALFMALSLLLIVLHALRKVPKLAAIIVIGLLAFFDLYSTNLRYVSSSNYQSERRHKEHYTPRPVDKKILQDQTLHYRVLDNSINTFNSSFASYFHKTIGGYHAAKLQRYQDIIDYHISKNNANVLNMLNCKYYITGQPGKEDVGLNSAALGNAWFVNNIKIVPNADAEIEALSDFDPMGDAIVHQEFKEEVGNLSRQKSGSIDLIEYRPNKLTYKSNSMSNQIAVFSEIWYGPNKGWKASIDGKPVSHFRANYVLRAMAVPSGEHTIVFEFNPDSNRLGIIISWICSILLLIGFAMYFWYNRKGLTYKDSEEL